MSGRRRFSDHWTREAKARSFPARSVFKLEEMDGRVGLLHKGDHVLDLGSAPGSWLLWASQRVGSGGLVAGFDLGPLSIDLPPNARFFRADVLALDLAHIPGLPAAWDVVLSDMAPSTSGMSGVDQERSWELFERALGIAIAALKIGGRFAGKLFFSPRHEEALALMRPRFKEVRTLRPRVTRAMSREVFVVGLGARSDAGVVGGR